MDDELTRLKADVDTLHGRVGGLESRFSGLDSKVDENHSVIMAALNKIAGNTSQDAKARPSVFRRMALAIAALSAAIVALAYAVIHYAA